MFIIQLPKSFKYIKSIYILYIFTIQFPWVRPTNFLPKLNISYLKLNGTVKKFISFYLFNSLAVFYLSVYCLTWLFFLHVGLLSAFSQIKINYLCSFFDVFFIVPIVVIVLHYINSVPIPCFTTFRSITPLPLPCPNPALFHSESFLPNPSFAKLMGSWAVSSHVLCFLPFRYIKVLLPPIILTRSLSMCTLSTLLWCAFHLQKPLSVPCIYLHPELPLLHSSLLKKWLDMSRKHVSFSACLCHISASFYYSVFKYQVWDAFPWQCPFSPPLYQKWKWGTGWTLLHSSFPFCSQPIQSNQGW